MHNKKWYMISTISGKEKKVKESLENRIIAESLNDYFEKIEIFEIPFLNNVELFKKLNNQTFLLKKKALYPGYMFIKMHMINKIWFIIRNTQYVTGLVGSSGQRAKPTPVSEAKIQKIKNKVENIKQKFEKNKIQTPFIKDKLVEILDGPNKGQIAKIIDSDDYKKIAIIEIVMFERKIPLEIEYKYLKIK